MLSGMCELQGAILNKMFRISFSLRLAVEQLQPHIVFSKELIILCKPIGRRRYSNMGFVCLRIKFQDM